MIEPTQIQILVLCAALAQVVFEYFLKRANERHLWAMRNEPPPESGDLMNRETWAKATDYSLAKSRFASVEDAFGFVLFVGVFLYLFPFAFSEANWKTEVSMEASPWLCAFVVTVFLTALQIPSLFFDWRKQFSLEEKFGFNKSTKGLWVVDKIKGSILGFAFSLLLLALMIWLYREVSSAFPDTWWVLVFVVFFGIQLLLMILWPKFIIPLFNKLSPLEEGELRDRLMALSEKTGFKAQAIEVIDGSKRSGHSNAYFTGFGKFRRIVLYDTLIEQMETEEIEAVLAHEVGHYKLGHIPKRLAISFFLGLGGFFLLSYFLKSSWFYEGFALDDDLTNSFAPALVVFSLALGFFTYWLSPISNHFSRKHEFEADHFAKEAVGSPEPLVSALRKLYVENLSHPLPHPLMTTFHYSHPTLLEREKALREDT
ncbi:MAG: M48 family metallopeptidase [Opitutae bacterium]|jgi:STE24 endopeptidase|nr:M48 family metallopeptidase [Opitutae bacterium]